jgi:hypothetical protein
MTCGIFVQFSKCKILIFGKFITFIASCTLCRYNRRICLNIFEEFIDFYGVTVASWILDVANGRKVNSLSGNIL